MEQASYIYVSDREELLEIIAENYEMFEDKTLRFEIKPYKKNKIDLAVLFSNIEIEVLSYNKKNGILKLKFSEPVSVFVLDKIFDHYIPIISVKN